MQERKESGQPLYDPYIQALDRLRYFVDSADPSKLETITDTARSTLLVGWHLRSIIHKLGTLPVSQEGEINEDVGLVINIPYESGNKRIFMRDLESSVFVQTFIEKNGKSESEYQIVIPSTDEFPLFTDDEQPSEKGYISNYAVERNGLYVPITGQDISKNQQGYVHMLKKVVDRVLAVVPQPK